MMGGLLIETPDPRAPLMSPCPCGSGRTYKRCWPVEKRKVAEARAAIRDSTAQVGAYAAGFDREMTEFEKFFFGPAREEFDEDEFEEYMDQVSETVTVAFMDIFAADYVLRSGWTVIERPEGKRRPPPGCARVREVVGSGVDGSV